MIEEWRPIAGFDGYSVSNHGHVRSERRFIPNTRGRGGVRSVRERILKPKFSKGYRAVDLCCDGMKRTRKISVLVAAAFIGPRPVGLHVCHNDGNSQNDHSNNLRYDTPKANTADMVRHGTSLRGETIGNAILSEEAVRFIRADRTLSQEALGARFNVSQSTISLVKRRERWSHLP